MTTPNKIAANRQNALRSTGPRTPEGKAIVSQNAVRHGIFAAGSVLPGLESRARWKEHLQATVANLAPIGQVEVALAERVALILWRLSRVSSFEQDVTHRARVRVYDEMLVKRRPILAIEGVDTIDDVLKRLTLARARLRALQRFADGAPDTPLGGHHVHLILTALSEQLDGFDAEGFCAPEIAPDDVAWVHVSNWTVEQFRRLVDAIAVETERDPDQLIAAATDSARDAVNRERVAQRSFERQVRDLRAERVLPEAVPLDRMVRYENHLTRQLDQTLKQLRALQQARRSAANQDASASLPLPTTFEADAAANVLPLSIAMGRGLGGGASVPAVPNPPADLIPPSRITPDLTEVVALPHRLPPETTGGPESASPAHTEI